MILNCGVEKTFESPLDCKEIQPAHPKGNQSWIFIGRIDAEAETLILWPPDVKNWLIWKDRMLGKMKAGGEGDDRGWDGWLVSLTQWTRIWVNSRSWWWTGRLGVLQSMGSQRVGHDWVTELNLPLKDHILLSNLISFPWNTRFVLYISYMFPHSSLSLVICIVNICSLSVYLYGY